MSESTTELQRAGTGVKPPLSYVLDFGPALDRIAEVMARGAKKYSRNNWKGGGKNAELATQLDSVMRHLAARQCGEVYDADMGTDHLANAACGILFALYHHGKAPATNALPVQGTRCQCVTWAEPNQIKMKPAEGLEPPTA